MSDLLTTLQKNYKKGIYAASEVPILKRAPTGIPTLDAALGGGLPIGRIIELYGLESGGKSATCLSIAETFVQAGLSVLYIDMERTVTQESVENNNLISSPGRGDFVISRAEYGEEAIEQIIHGVNAGAKLVILDSVAMLQPKSTYDKLEKDTESRDVGGTAGMLNRLKGRIIDAIEYNEAVLIMINQVRDNLKSPHGGLDTPGGHALKHMCSIRIQITYTSKDQNVPGKVIANVKLPKNKTFTPHLTCEIPILNGVVQREEALAITAEKLGVLERSGAWYYLAATYSPNQEKTKLAQGLSKLSLKIKEDAELLEIIKNAVSNLMKPEAEDTDD